MCFLCWVSTLGPGFGSLTRFFWGQQGYLYGTAAGRTVTLPIRFPPGCQLVIGDVFSQQAQVVGSMRQFQEAKHPRPKFDLRESHVKSDKKEDYKSPRLQ